MRPAARLQTAIEAMAAVFATRKPADAVLSHFFRGRRFIGSHDRAELASNIYAALRHHSRIGWWLQRAGLPEDARTSVLCWYLLQGMKLEQMETLCSGGQYAPGPIHRAEMEGLRKLEGRTIEHPEMPEAVKLELPEWAESGLRQAFGPELTRELRALQEQAPVDIRANSLKMERAALQAALASEGIKTSVLEKTTHGLRVEGRPNLAATAAYKAGAFEIQDEGSQRLAALVNAKAGEQVVDFCAGAGGKTLAVAAQMGGKGRIIACDTAALRLKRAQERFKRAGAHNIETRALESARDPWVKRHKEKFDRVLIDAPCTGVGVWRRNPDARWRPLGPGLAALLPLQQDILQSAARLVKPGGQLVYATCSLLPEENGEQIKAFLASDAGKGFTLRETLTLTPARDQTDGFFGAVLIRG